MKQKCDSPQGTDNPQTPGYTYTCWAGPCGTSNANCDAGFCCEGEIGKDVDGDGRFDSCVGRGTITLDRSYLCTSAS